MEKKKEKGQGGINTLSYSCYIAARGNNLHLDSNTSSTSSGTATSQEMRRVPEGKVVKYWKNFVTNPATKLGR